MQSEGLSPDVIPFHLDFKGSHILQRSFLAKITNLGSILVQMYAKCGDLVKVEQAFTELPTKTIVCLECSHHRCIHGQDYDAIKLIILVHLMCLCSRLALCCKILRQVINYLAEYVYEMWLFRRGTQCVQQTSITEYSFLDNTDFMICWK